jgi:hypothetical protein
MFAAASASLPTPPLALARTPAENLGFSTQAAEFARETDWLLERGGFEPAVPHGENRSPSRAEPEVRIHLSPAGSQERTPHRRCTICGVGFTDVIRPRQPPPGQDG